jgi:DTW domain-containing protein
MPQVQTQTQVLFLQHPRERFVAVNTCRMAHLALPNSALVVGTHVDDHPALSTCHAAPDECAVVFPGPQAMPVEQCHPPPKRIIFVDGTWSQAKKLLKLNPRLAALPRVAFTPAAPSRYRIRKEPADDFVSTIEAVVHVLGVLENNPERVQALLIPFDAMVERQLDAARDHAGTRHRFVRARSHQLSPEVDALLDPSQRTLALVVEANCFPFHARMEGEPEPLHIVAKELHPCAPATTPRSIDLLLRPRRPLAPGVPSHLQMDASSLMAGMSTAEGVEAFRAFCGSARFVTWGSFARDVLAREGITDHGLIDLRVLAARLLRRSAHGIPAALAHFEATPQPPSLRGRAGLRVEQLLVLAAAIAAATQAQVAQRNRFAREPR